MLLDYENAPRRRRPGRTATAAERRATGGEIRNDTFPATRFFATLIGTCSIARGEVLNESANGIGISIRSLPDVELEVGTTLDIVFKGDRRRGEVRHMTPDANGYFDGIAWMEQDTVKGARP